MLKSVKILTMLIAIFALSACSNVKADKNVYASEIIVKQSIIERVVGDEFRLSDQFVSLKPFNAKFNEIKVISGDSDVANYNQETNTITCLKAGTATINISAISNIVNGITEYIDENITLKVNEKPVYVSDIAFENDLIEINVGTKSAFNNPIITLTNNSVISFSELNSDLIIESNLVSYSKNGVIEYNPKTGKIDVVNYNADKVEEITVSLRLVAGPMFNATKTFKVVLTNNVYATDINILNVEFEDGVSQEIVMFENSSLKLDVKINSIVQEYKYNLEFIALFNESYVDINYTQFSSDNILDGYLEILSGNVSGNYNIILQVQSDRYNVIEKTINIIVIEKINNLNINLYEINGTSTDKFYIEDDFNYILKIESNVNINKNNLNFYIDNEIYMPFYEVIETENNNEYKIKFNENNNLINNIIVKYTQHCFNESYIHSSNVIYVELYNYVSDYNVYISQNNITASVNDNNDSIVYLIDNNYVDEAVNDKVVFNPNITITPSNMRTISEYSLYFKQENSLIEVTNGFENDDFIIDYDFENKCYLLTPINVGEIKFVVVSNDPAMFEKEFIIEILEKQVEEFEFKNYKKDLYVNIHPSNIDKYNNFYDLNNIIVLPNYAFNKSLEFYLSTENASINNNKLYANGVGEVALSVQNSNLINTVIFNIQSCITGVMVRDIVEGTEGDNNNQLTILKTRIGETMSFNFYKIVENDRFSIDKNLKVRYVNELGEYENSSDIIKQIDLTFTNILTLEVKGYGRQLIEYSLKDENASYIGLILVVVEREFDNIVDIYFNFSKQTFDINLYYENVFNNRINITTENNKPYNINNISITSNNDSVFVNNDGCVDIMLNGFEVVNSVIVTITATASTDTGDIFDYYYLNIFYKEPTTKIENIEFESSEITLNTYYETEVYNPATIYLENDELETDDVVRYISSNSNLILVDEITGNTTLTEAALRLSEIESITIYAVVNNYEKIFSYEINIYYLAPTTHINRIEFESSKITLNTYYETEVYNPATIYLENGELETDDVVRYISSNSNLILVDEITGEITLTETALRLSEIESITIYAVVNNYEKVFSYEINIYYLAPTTYINNIEFESSQIILNTYYETEVYNPATIYLENDELETNDIVKYISSNTDLVLVDELTGEITLTETALRLSEIETITIYAVVNNYEKIFTYEINIYYLAPTTYIDRIEFESSEITLNTYYETKVYNPATIYLENEELETDDIVRYISSNTNLILVDEITGDITLTEAALRLSEIETVIIYAVVNNNEKVFDYEINIYYLAPLTFIDRVEFDSSKITLNTYYETKVYNPATIYLENDELETNDIVKYVSSSTDLVLVDELTGAITLTENALLLEIEKSITIYAVVNNYEKVFSYEINIYYLAPTTYIDRIEFESSEITLNTYYETEVYNPATIYLENDELETNDIVKYVSSSTDLVLVDELTGEITLTENALMLEIEKSITIYAVVNNYEKVFSYEINIYYQVIFDEIVALNFEIKSFNKVVESLNNIEFTNQITLNSGNYGVYDYSKIILTHSEDVVVIQNKNILTIKPKYAGYYTIYAKVLGTNIVDSFSVEVDLENKNEIKTFEDFLVASVSQEEYYLVGDIFAPSNFQTILEYKGNINGNGFKIGNLQKTLFNKMFEGSIIKNVVFEFEVRNSYITKVENLFGSVAIENHGKIENSTIYLTYENTDINSLMVGGVVAYNYGEIVNAHILINANNLVSSGVNIGAFTYINIGIIENSSVLSGSEVSGFAITVGFVYENQKDILNSQTHLSMNIVGNVNAFGFVYENKGNENLNIRAILENNKCNVTYKGAYNMVFVFVGMSDFGIISNNIVTYKTEGKGVVWNEVALLAINTEQINNTITKK